MLPVGRQQQSLHDVGFIARTRLRQFLGASELTDSEGLIQARLMEQTAGPPLICRSTVCYILVGVVLSTNHFSGKLINAWTQTPTKWYPLPLAVGAFLLVAIQYRKKSKRARREVDVNEDGLEVIRLKGPWHVRVSTFLDPSRRSIQYSLTYGAIES